jgi:hypothetical protein
LAAVDPVFTVPAVEGQSSEERGLLGIAIDPAWPLRPFVYFIHSRTGGATRIVRYLASDDVDLPNGEQLSLASPRILIDDIPDLYGNHNGGTLRFGPDGCLYASLGDDAVYCDAADSTTLRGAILRLRVDTLPIFGAQSTRRSAITPPDNPFVSSPDSNARLVYAFGFRNPFRFHIDPVTGTLYAADVGEGSYEEVDEVVRGGFHGWPWREGDSPVLRYDCPEPGGFGSFPYTHPIAVEPHGQPVGYAIISAGMYRPVFHGVSNWPPVYYSGRGDLFYGQYYQGYLRRLHFDGAAWGPAAPVPGQPNTTDWATGLLNSVDFQVGPDGSLWWMAQFDESYDPVSGSLHRIVHVGLPTAVGDAPVESRVLRATPNPSRTPVELTFATAVRGRARLALYDLAGRRVRSLFEGELPAGESRVRWDGAGDQGAAVGAGVYFARLEREGAPSITTRVLRLR